VTRPNEEPGGIREDSRSRQCGARSARKNSRRVPFKRWSAPHFRWILFGPRIRAREAGRDGRFREEVGRAAHLHDGVQAAGGRTHPVWGHDRGGAFARAERGANADSAADQAERERKRRRWASRPTTASTSAPISARRSRSIASIKRRSSSTARPTGCTSSTSSEGGVRGQPLFGSLRVGSSTPGGNSRSVRRTAVH
jgi:hypothetical protein